MARIVSRLIALDELAAPQTASEPPAPRPAPLQRRLRGLLWLVPALLGFTLSRPLGAFLTVFALAWAVLSGFVVELPPLAKSCCRRLPGWARLRRDVLFDESGRIGANGEVATLRHLADLPDDYVILHDVQLPTDTGGTQADLLVLGPPGAWVLEVKAWSGQVYGREDERYWTQVKPYAGEVVRDRRDNPVRQNAYHCAALRAYLEARGIACPVRSVVVFTEARLQTRTDTPVVPLSQIGAVMAAGAAAAVLPPEQVSSLAEALATLIPDPTRVEYTSLRAVAQEAAAVEPRPTSVPRAGRPQGSPQHQGGSGESQPAGGGHEPAAACRPAPGPPGRGTAARLALRAGALFLLLGLFILATLPASAALNAFFHSLAPGAVHGPLVTARSLVPVAFVLWLTQALNALLPPRRRQRR